MANDGPNTKKEKEHFFDKPGNVRRFLRTFFVLCGVLIFLDVINWVLHLMDKPGLRHADPEHSWEGWTGFYAIFGFVACVLLVLAAKQLRKVVMRKEDYYDD